MTTRQYKLTPFIHGRKYLTGLIFVVEGDQQKFFAMKISLSTVFKERIDLFMHHNLTCALSFSALSDYDDERCVAGKVYQSCGSYCPGTCNNPDAFRSCNAACAQGCFCPVGLVEFRDRCVDPLECPALLAGKFSDVD